MITRPNLWRKTEDRMRARHPLAYLEALLIYDALYKEARLLGALNKFDLMEDLKADLRLAEALNRLRAYPSKPS